MVSKIPAMIDMAMDSEEQKEMANPSPPRYPYGLCISLGDPELEKLDLDTTDVSIGDILHMHVLAKVTSISQRDDEVSGACCRIELQITNISAESEDDENEESAPVKRGPSKLYSM